MRYVTNENKDLVTISRSGEVAIIDEAGRERERHKIPYGAVMKFRDGDLIKGGVVLAEWDPHTRPIITEYVTANLRMLKMG